MIYFYTDKTNSVGLLIEQLMHELVASVDPFPRTQQSVIRFSHTQYYLPNQPQLELLALVVISLDEGGVWLIEGSIFHFTPEHLEQLQQLLHGLSACDGLESGTILQQYCRNHLLPWLVMSDPWLLVPVHIVKPWGQEIWYTGIETRGQSGVVGDRGIIPLPWLLDLMSEQVSLPDGHQPILLKVLDPLPDEVYGDLYFELHQEKQEVYVVTHIDPKAWPEGVGAIQLGFSPEMRQRYQHEDEFKRAYLGSVRAYEQVRRLIDLLLDEKRVAAGIAKEQSVTHSRLISWINELSQQIENKALFEAEVELRKTMNSFVANHPLTLGDVVAIPKLVPHALQHGVRVVEFQTPVYERKILSFGQKVLTQSHWDTESALELVDLNVAQAQPPELLNASQHTRIERIVNFDDFAVQRIQLNGSYTFKGNVYSVLMVLQGQLRLSSAERTCDLDSGQAVLLVKADKGWMICSSSPCLLLLASPQQFVK